MSLLSKLITRLQHSAIAKDSSWAIIGSAVGKGASMLIGVIIARLLGAEDFGEYGMVKSTLFYIAVFSTFGLGCTTTKYIAQHKSNDYGTTLSIIKNSLLITLLTSGIMAVLLLLFAGYITADKHLIAILRYISLVVIFNAVNTTQLGLLSGFKDFKAIARNNAITGIVTLLSGVPLTYYMGLVGAIISLFVSTLLQCVLNHISVRGHLQKIREQNCHSSVPQQHFFRKLFVFSLPIAMQEGVYSSANWLRMIMITSLAGYEELGLYTATNQWYIMIMFIPGVLRNVVLSHLSSTLDNNSQNRNTFSTMLKINIATTLLPALLIIAASPLIELFYGATFDGLSSIISIAAILSVFGCIGDIYVQDFISKGKNWTMFLCGVFRNYGSLLLAWPFMIKYGAAYGASIAFATLLFIQIIYCGVLHYLHTRK